MSGEDEPNEEMLALFHEVDEMKKTGSGRKFDNLDDLWASFVVPGECAKDMDGYRREKHADEEE